MLCNRQIPAFRLFPHSSPPAGAADPPCMKRWGGRDKIAHHRGSFLSVPSRVATSSESDFTYRESLVKLWVNCFSVPFREVETATIYRCVSLSNCACREAIVCLF